MRYIEISCSFLKSLLSSELAVISPQATSVCREHESGWKDTVYVPLGETVTVIAKFDDFADAVNPYMYHCHFSNHEDGGMMGQFLVN